MGARLLVVCPRRVGFPYSDVASRDAAIKPRLGAHQPHCSWVVRVTKRLAPTGAGKSASRSGGPESGSFNVALDGGTEPTYER